MNEEKKKGSMEKWKKGEKKKKGIKKEENICCG